jgi:P4 family phage/plasmid primase-like protien
MSITTKTTNYNFDVKFLNEQLSRNEKGYAEIICKYYPYKIILGKIDTTIAGYMWNNEKCLYTTYSLNHVVGEFSDLLEKAINFLIDEVNKTDLLDANEKNKKIQNFKKIRNTINTSNKIKNFESFLLEKYLNTDLYNKMDSADNMIPLKNKKIINLKTEEIRDRNDNDYFTYEKDCVYLGRDANVKNVDNFIDKMCCGNKEKKEFLKMILGYSITKETNLKSYYIFYGPEGNNGKTTLTETLGHVFKEQYVALSADLIYSKKEKENINQKFSQLIGKTIGTSSEPSYNYIDSPIIKLLTGSDSISARRLYKDEITIYPTIKIFILLNKVLHIEDETAMRTRTKVINFNAYFYDENTKNDPKIKTKYKYEGDPELSKKLKNEWKDEFFTYIVNCAIDFLKLDVNKIKTPKIIVDETNAYFNEGDIMAKIINEKFEITKDPKDKVLKSEIIEFYKNNCLKRQQDYKLDKITAYLDEKLGISQRTSGFSKDGLMKTGQYFYLGIKYICNDLMQDLIETQEEETNEKDELRKENNELKEQMKQMTEQLEELKQLIKTKNEPKAVITTEEPKKEENKGIKHMNIYHQAEMLDIDIDLDIKPKKRQTKTKK